MYSSGIPEAGTPLNDEYSKASGIQSIRVFGKSTYGVGRQIIPIPFATRIGEGKSMIIVDDLITQADTKFEAISAAEELGFKVTGVIVLFDREQGGAQQLEARGYKLYAALRLTDTLRFYLEANRITEERYNQVMDYLGQS